MIYTLRLAGLLAAALAVMAATFLFQRVALAHDHKGYVQAANGDDRRNEWFQSLKRPSGGSCCNLTDCRATEAEDRNGVWWAIVREKWTRIPPEVVLQKPLSIDGDAYVCSSTGYGTPIIYCFLPPIPGY